MSEHVVIMSTTDSEEKAKALSAALVKERLVACAQRMRIESVYEWEGEVNDDPEFLILFKTNKANQDRAIDEIKRQHTYDEPEIVVLPIVAGSPGYLGWIDSVTN